MNHHSSASITSQIVRRQSDGDNSSLIENEADRLQNRRSIQSFVLRQGRLTQAQARALEILEPCLGLPAGQPVVAATLFGRNAPLVVEIGFGNGDSLATMAAVAPEMNFIGIEVHPPGVGHLLLEIERLGLSNVRIHRGDAVKFLDECISDASVHCFQIFFPDPWHKKKHHKRRLINPAFVALAARKLQAGGRLHIATDWQNYAEHILAVLNTHPEFVNLAGHALYAERPDYRPLTKFEQRGQRLGHGVWDIIFVRT